MSLSSQSLALVLTV